MTIKRKKALAIFLVSSLPLVYGFASLFSPSPQQEILKIGSWKKMSGAAPVEVRTLIGSLLAGNKFVVWGGEIKDKPVSDGAIYDLDNDIWKKMPAAPIEGREHFTMLPYGQKVICWGGENTPSGAIYDIRLASWKKMSDSPITLGMEPYTSGIVGHKLLVWGIGKTRELNPVGAIYDIDNDSWKKMAEPASIKAIDDWPAFIYKNKFVVWGAPPAGAGDCYGAVYDLDKDVWTEMARAPLERRNWSAAVLVDGKLVIWGGAPGPVEVRTAESRSDGAVYDIDKDTWRKMSASPLEARWAPRVFAWGRKVVIWGGMGKSESKDKFFDYDGAIYDVEKDAWEKIAEAPLEGEHPRELYSYGIFGYNPTPPALSGSKLIVWSVYCHAIYDLEKKTWQEMADAPIGGRDYHASLLCGNRLVLWGGRDSRNAYSDGAIFRIPK